MHVRTSEQYMHGDPKCKLPTVCLAGKLEMHGQHGRCNKMRTAIARRGSCSSDGRIVPGGSRRGSRRTPSCRTPSCGCKKRRSLYRKQHACPVTHESLQRNDKVDRSISVHRAGLKDETLKARQI